MKMPESKFPQVVNWQLAKQEHAPQAVAVSASLCGDSEQATYESLTMKINPMYHLAILASAIFAFIPAAQAQGKAQAQNSEKRCAATDASSGQQARAKDGDMNAMSSNCRLINGDIGRDSMTNDGSSDDQAFGRKKEDQSFNRWNEDDGTHALRNGGGLSGNGRTGGGGMPRVTQDTSLGSTDEFAQPQNNSLLGWGGAQAPAYGRMAMATPDDTSLLTRGASLPGAVGNGGGIGGGGAAGGLQGRQDTATELPAIPEPHTYAMVLAGLGLVAFAARRKRQARA